MKNIDFAYILHDRLFLFLSFILVTYACHQLDFHFKNKFMVHADGVSKSGVC